MPVYTANAQIWMSCTKFFSRFIKTCPRQRTFGLPIQDCIFVYLTRRFFILFGAIILVFILGYILPPFYPVALTLLATASAVVLTDAFLLYIRGNQSVECRRLTAPVWSLGDPNPVQLQLTNKGRLSFLAAIIEELPEQLQRRDFLENCVLLPGKPVEVRYEVTPLTRGLYVFHKTRVFLSTRIGLVERRLSLNGEQEVRVYPSVVQMKRYELRALRQTACDTGIRKLRRIGHSYEFEQIKNYTQGDDYRSVNWKASGRRATIMVNQYEDERSQQVYCIIDKSRVMHMPFGGLSLMDYAVNSTLALSNIILKKQDKAGLFTFSDVLGTTLKAENDTSQLRRIMDALYNEKERNTEANFELLYEAAQRLIGSRALLLLFTNFENRYALERTLPLLRRLHRKHLLVVVIFENTEIRDLAHLPAEKVADIYRLTVARKFLHDKKEIVQTLRQYGIQALLTKPEELTLHTINKYLELKARGMA